MTTENLLIRIDERGARVVSRNIEQIGRSSRRASGGVQLLSRALGFIGGAAILRTLGRTADTFTTIQNRLRLVTESTQELNTVQNELLGISNRTRSSFETNAGLFNRLALSTRDLGLSQADVLEITESLNQAVQISGATATEANNALIQLSQGLASGALRGDELRSVLEQLPRVADVIATELGVTRGELRELGAQGAITADVVTRAFRNSRDVLAEEFGQTVPTLGQAFNVLRNNFTNLVGSLDQGAGITRGLATLIIELSNNTADLGTSFRDAGLAVREFVSVSTVALLNFFESVGPRFRRFQSTLVGTIATIFGNDEVADQAIAAGRSAEEALATVRDRLRNELDQIQADFAAQRAQFAQDDVAADLTAAGERRISSDNAISTSTQNLIDSQTDLLASLRLQEQALVEAINTGEEYDVILERLETNAIAAQTGLQGLAFDINDTREELRRLQEVQERGETLAGLEEQNAALQTALASGRDLADVLQEVELAQQFDGDSSGLERVLALVAANTELETQLENLADLRDQQATNQETLQSLRDENEALQQAAESGRELNSVLAELEIRRDFAGDAAGLEEALDLTAANEQLRDQLDEAQGTVTDFLRRARENAQDLLGDALASAFSGGLEEIPARFAQLLVELSSQFLASEIFRALGNLGQGGGGGGGGTGGFLQALGGFFAGSFNTGGQFTVPGAGGPDSVRTTMDLTPRETVTITPAGQPPPGSGAPPVVNVAPPQVVVVNSMEQARQFLASGDGETSVLEIIRNNPDTIRGVT